MQDGTAVSAETLNPILSQFVQNQEYLYERFGDLSNQSVLIAPGLPLMTSTSGLISAPQVVFYGNDTDSEGISPAIVQYSSSSPYTSAYTAANSSYGIGIIKQVNGSTSADVFIWGLVQLDNNIDDPTYGLVQSNEIDQAAPFPAGPYYLSRTEAGKITRNPGGVAVYVGYAFDRTNFLLAPRVSELNQFFTSFRFNILDRPAGTPALSTGIWSINNVSIVSGDGGINHVGWVPVASLVGGPLEALTPAGSQFYYNFPSTPLINADTALDNDTSVRAEQILLDTVLPPNPISASMLVVNGLIQTSRDDDPVQGIYSINQAGIWWYSNTDGQQPWSSDITISTTVTFDYTTSKVTVPNGAFQNGDELRFSGGTVPAALSATTTYYVVNQAVSGSNQLIQLATSVSGSVVTFSDNGSGTITIPQLYTWKWTRGTESYRPKMVLQFFNLNPDLTESVVTSLNLYNPASTILQFYKSDKSSLADVGDLLARVLLNFANGSISGNGTAVSNLTYTESTGAINVSYAPVVNQIVAGSNITVTQSSSGGTPVPGSFIISANSGSQTGRVTSLEPDGCELLYVSLNSYLSMPSPTTLPSSVIGKILLPTTVPDSDMNFTLYIVGLTPLSQGNTSNVVNYTFNYTVSQVGQVLSSSATSSSFTFNIPNTSAAYSAGQVFQIGNVGTAAYSIPVAITIPASVINGGQCSVNFQLVRTQPGSNAYTGAIGLVDIFYTIG